MTPSSRTFVFSFSLLALLPTGGRAERFVVSAPTAIEDVALRNREFADWNFGAGPFLEAGFMGGIYEEHYGVSLIRFDLASLACERVHSATLRLYKPNCFVQTSPIEVQVYEVAAANSGWTEGTSFCAAETVASCWRWMKSGKPWAGEEGCRGEGVDYLTPALDVQTAPAEYGQWLAFSIPATLVQKWLEHPEANAGLYISAGNMRVEEIEAEENDEHWGKHAFFFSSEHYSDKGPQLIIEGTPGEPRSSPRPRTKPRQVLPPQGAYFEKWLASNERLSGFTRDCHMNREQAHLFFYFDTTVRGDLILAEYQVRFNEIIHQLDTLIAQGDEVIIRQKLKEIRNILLSWEYIRETCWYTAGPLADVLSPLQLGILFGKSIFGRMEEKAIEEGSPIWIPLTDSELEDNIVRTVAYTASKLGLSLDQMAVMEPVIRKCETLENNYVRDFRASFDEAKDLIETDANGEEMFDCVKRMHLNHELFLYYQSIYDTPRWSMFMAHAPALPFFRWAVEARVSQYNDARIDSQLTKIKKYGYPFQTQTSAQMILDEEAILALYGGGGFDVSPSGLGILSNAAIVWHDYGDSSRAGHAAYSVVLYDESVNPPTGSLSIIASAADLGAAIGVPASQARFRGINVIVGSDDNVYFLAADTSLYLFPESYAMNIFRIPNTGCSTFGTPEVLVDANRLGHLASGVNYRLAIDTEATPDTLIVVMDDQETAHDTTTNGIYSLPATANNDIAPVLLHPLGNISAAAGGTPGVDKAAVNSMVVIPGGDIIINDSRTGTAHSGNIVRMNRDTGLCTLIVNRDIAETTGEHCALTYNARNGRLGVFWDTGTNQTAGDPHDDRLEERDIQDGRLLETLIYRDALVVLNPDNTSDASFRTGWMSLNFTNDGTCYCAFSSHGVTGAEEALYRIAASASLGEGALLCTY